MTRPLQAAPTREERIRHNYEAELRLMDIKLLCSICAAILLVAGLVVLWLGANQAARQCESMRDTMAAAFAQELELLDGQIAGKTRSLEEAHLANVAQYESLIECGCTPDRWKSFEEFAGPDPGASGTVLITGEGDVLQPPEKGPIRLESK